MRLFPALAIILIALLPPARNAQQSKPAEQHAKGQDTSGPAPVTVNVVQNPSFAPPQQNCPQPQAHNWHEWFWPPIWSNWGLIIVAAFAACAAFHTIGEIKRQSASTEKAANAARDNALAVINAERAWVTIDVNWSPGAEMGLEGTGTEHIVNVTIRYKNDGKTPAWITERRARLKITSDMSLPEKPDLADTEIIKYGTESLPVGQTKEFDTPLECVGIPTLDNITVVYGVIRYRTAFVGTVGETVFGYRIAFGGQKLERLDLPEWNTDK